MTEHTTESACVNASIEETPTDIVLTAIIMDGKILLLKRDNAPYTGYWGFPGGKIKFGENIKEAAAREAREETGLDCEFEALRGIASEIIKPQNRNYECKHFMLFVCQLKPKQLQLTQSIEGEVQWFELSKLPDKVNPSDLAMLKEFIVENQRSLPLHNVFVREAEQNYFLEAFHA